MPGLYQEGYLHHLLPYEVYKKLIPDEEMRPKIYQLKNNQTLFLEGFRFYDLSRRDPTVVLYVDRNLSVQNK
jgi:hypothetical protein